MNSAGAFFVLTLAGLVPAQGGIRIVRIPDAVRLPAAPGTNLLLEVELTFAPQAGGVWIATAATDTDTVPLVPAGAQHHQVNLATPRLAAQLPAGVDHGELFVFARDGRTLHRSAAIAWTRGPSPSGGPHCLVRSDGAETVTLAPGQRSWIDLGTLTAIEIQGAGARQDTAVAHVGQTDLPLRRDAGRQVWCLTNDEPLRRCAVEEQRLEIEVQQGSVSHIFAFDLVPQRLRLPDGEAHVVVQQRRRGILPGTHDWVRVHLDDITGGSVLLTLTTATGQPLAPPRLLRERDFVPFRLGDQECVLVVASLVNQLIGEDHADLLVRPAAGFRPDVIGLLVAAVAASKDTFVRDGEEFSGELAAQFLTAKLANHRGPPPGVDEFVATFASQSSRTGTPYQVRRADGNTLTMRAWLEAARKELER